MAPLPMQRRGQHLDLDLGLQGSSARAADGPWRSRRGSRSTPELLPSLSRKTNPLQPVAAIVPPEDSFGTLPAVHSRGVQHWRNTEVLRGPPGAPRTQGSSSATRLANALVPPRLQSQASAHAGLAVQGRSNGLTITQMGMSTGALSDATDMTQIPFGAAMRSDGFLASPHRRGARLEGRLAQPLRPRGPSLAVDGYGYELYPSDGSGTGSSLPMLGKGCLPPCWSRGLSPTASPLPPEAMLEASWQFQASRRGSLSSFREQSMSPHRSPSPVVSSIFDESASPSARSRSPPSPKARAFKPDPMLRIIPLSQWLLEHGLAGGASTMTESTRADTLAAGMASTSLSELDTSRYSSSHPMFVKGRNFGQGGAPGFSEEGGLNRAYVERLAQMAEAKGLTLGEAGEDMQIFRLTLHDRSARKRAIDLGQWRNWMKLDMGGPDGGGGSWEDDPNNPRNKRPKVGPGTDGPGGSGGGGAGGGDDAAGGGPGADGYRPGGRDRPGGPGGPGDGSDGPDGPNGGRGPNGKPGQGGSGGAGDGTGDGQNGPGGGTGGKGDDKYGTVEVEPDDPNDPNSPNYKGGDEGGDGPGDKGRTRNRGQGGEGGRGKDKKVTDGPGNGMGGDLDIDGLGKKGDESDDEPHEPGALFKINKKPSQLAQDFPDGVLFPDPEAARQRRAQRTGEGQEEDDDDDIYGETQHDFGSLMPGLRTGLAEMFREAIKDSWAKVMLEAVEKGPLGADHMSTSLPPRPAEFHERRSESKGSVDMAALRSLPGSPTMARRPMPPPLKEDEFGETDTSTLGSPMPGRSESRRMDREMTDCPYSMLESPKRCPSGFSVLESPKGSPVSSDVEESKKTLQRMQYARRLEAKTSALTTSRTQQNWRQRMKLCERTLGNLDSVGAFAARTSGGGSALLATTF